MYQNETVQPAACIVDLRCLTTTNDEPVIHKIEKRVTSLDFRIFPGKKKVVGDCGFPRE